MIPLQAVTLVFVALAGTAVVLQRDPLRQLMANGAYGLALVLLFVVFQALDVAYSALVVSTVAMPLVVLAAIRRVRRGRDDG